MFNGLGLCFEENLTLSFLRVHPSITFQSLLLTMRATPFLQKILAHISRNQRSNCHHLLDHPKSKRIPEKTSTSALLIMPKPLTV